MEELNFLNNNVKTLLSDNGTFLQILCPYTLQQHGRVKQKHRHIVETRLAMLFHARIPTSYWIHAFASAIYIIN